MAKIEIDVSEEILNDILYTIEVARMQVEEFRKKFPGYKYEINVSVRPVFDNGLRKAAIIL